MMKKWAYGGVVFFGLLILLGIGSTSRAEQPNPPGKLDADFVMERTLKVLSDTLTSSGKLILGGPGLLRWETLSPAKSVLVVNQGKAWLHYPDLDVTKRFDIGRDPVMKLLSEHLLALTSGNFSKIKALYEIEALEDGAKKLVPKQPEIKKVFSEIRIRFQKNNVVSRVELVSTGGDVTAITFLKVRLNPTLPKALFKVSDK